MKHQANLILLNLKLKGLEQLWRTQVPKLIKALITIANSVELIGEASSQLNSLLFPIIASIGIIVALQIAILARRR